MVQGTSSLTLSHVSHNRIRSDGGVETILPFATIPLLAFNQCFVDKVFDIFHSVGGHGRHLEWLLSIEGDG